MTTPEQGLYDAASRWDPVGGTGPEDVIEPWKQIGPGGRTFSRLPRDTVRFEIVPAPEHVGEFQVLVFVNEVEMTANGAGVGISPFRLLIGDNRLIATAEPRVVPIARCTCGDGGCGSTEVSILREGEAVHWDWLGDVPIDHGVSFRAELYDAEVARIGADHSWQRTEDTAARLILETVDRAALARFGLGLDWAAKDRVLPARFTVALRTLAPAAEEPGYQVFLRFRWLDRSPAEVAAEVAAMLRQPPESWTATYSAINPRMTAAPPMGGWNWQPEDLRR